MSAHVDYLRLATFDFPAHQYASANIMESYPGGWEQAGWLQYRGWKKEQIFVGRANQEDKLHGIIQISGMQSNQLFPNMQQLDKHYCTRLDVQMTIPMPENLKLKKVHKNLGKRISTLISSESNDTLYVGNRKSDIFTRLYQKPLDRMYLRLEFELKGQRSRAAWLALLAGATVDEIFKYYFERSKLPDAVKKHFDLADIGETDKAMRAEILKDSQKKLAWIQSIDSAIMQAMNDHDIGQEVKHIVNAWALVARNIDRMNEED